MPTHQNESPDSDDEANDKSEPPIQHLDPYSWDVKAAGEGRYPRIETESDLYRRVIHRKGLNPREQVLRGIFLRRPPTQDGRERDTNGLSVNIANGRTQEEVLQQEFSDVSKPCAICILKIEDVRSIRVPGTEITLDAVLSSPTHANIKRLPPHGSSGLYPEIAEKLATELAKKAVVRERE